MIQRSYTIDDQDRPAPQLDLSLLKSYATALCLGPLGRPYKGPRPQTLFPLVMLAKDESLRLYPYDPLRIVEINAQFGHSHYQTNFFKDWFQETRGREIFSAHLATLPRSKSRTKTGRYYHALQNERLATSQASIFEIAFSDVDYTNPGYGKDDLKGIEYHNLMFDPWKLLKSTSEKTVRSLCRETLESLELWHAIRACAASWTPRAFSAAASNLLERPMRLLSFDGGGVRGLSSLLVLQEVLAKVKNDGRLQIVPLPCEYFDMIVGTSIGGLIAILLGRLKLSVSQCIKLYEDVEQEIFGQEESITSSTRFSSRRFKEILRERIRRIMNVSHDEIFLRDPAIGQGRGCPVFVVTVDRKRVSDPDGVVLLRSYDTQSGRNFEESCCLWEAALATSAAPIFFSPARIKSKILVDGGLGHNNPTLHLIDEAQLRWPGRKLGTLVSIGTGKARSNRLAADDIQAHPRDELSTDVTCAQMGLAVTYDRGDVRSATTFRSAAVLGVDIGYPESPNVPSWQSITMDEPLLVPPQMGEKPSFSTSLDCSGWDEATSGFGSKYTWEVYFGGITADNGE